MRRNTQLPDGFAWSTSTAFRRGDDNHAFLVCEELDIAVVRRIGNGWIAVIDAAYCCTESNSCIVPSMWKGQCWVAAWLRREAPTVRVLIKYQQLCGESLDKRPEGAAAVAPLAYRIW